ncbi:hypothetical protein IFO70_27165 [Phormidium tenue FACHB-886]|nr:hypothetical protein [Phormidium tenue FACHB-886]
MQNLYTQIRCSTSTGEHWLSTWVGRSPASCYQKLLALADFLLSNGDFFHVWQWLWK